MEIGGFRAFIETVKLLPFAYISNTLGTLKEPK